MIVSVTYNKNDGYGIEWNNMYYPLRHMPWPSDRTDKTDATAIRWFRKELYNPRSRLPYKGYSEKPEGTLIIYSRESPRDENTFYQSQPENRLYP